MLLLDLVEQRQPVEPASLQPDVEEQQARLARGDRLQRLVGMGCRAGGKPLVLEDTGDEIADVPFVVDDQNIGGHESLTRICG